MLPIGWLVRHGVLLPLEWLFAGLWWLTRALGRLIVIVAVAFGRGVAAGWRWTAGRSRPWAGRSAGRSPRCGGPCCGRSACSPAGSCCSS
ncbi:hypothetical protein ACFQX7_02835 [Luedemannella flava]